VITSVFAASSRARDAHYNGVPRNGMKKIALLVIAGLDPAIHPSSVRAFLKKMDTRVRPAYDAVAGPEVRNRPDILRAAIYLRSDIEEIIMTDADTCEFVTKFAAAWAARDGEAFLKLWHPDGVLRTPFAGRAIAGSELGRLNDIQKQQAPDLVWQLLDWTWRGDVVIVEWQTSRVVGGKRFDFRGVDKFRLRDGKIVEEIVYADTAPMRAGQSGEVLKPLIEI
jgi:ketosteroid isomerase-like protein